MNKARGLFIGVIAGAGVFMASPQAFAGNSLTVEPSTARPGEKVTVVAHCDTKAPDFRGDSPFGDLADAEGIQRVTVRKSAKPGVYSLRMFCRAKETAPFPLAVGSFRVRSIPKPPAPPTAEIAAPAVPQSNTNGPGTGAPQPSGGEQPRPTSGRPGGGEQPTTEERPKPPGAGGEQRPASPIPVGGPNTGGGGSLVFAADGDLTTLDAAGDLPDGPVTWLIGGLVLAAGITGSVVSVVRRRHGGG